MRSKRTLIKRALNYMDVLERIEEEYSSGEITSSQYCWDHQYVLGSLESILFALGISITCRDKEKMLALLDNANITNS